MINQNKLFIFIISVLLLLISTSVFCISIQKDHIELELISEQESIQPGKKLILILRMKMEKGWHIYWINPAGPGFPPTIKWQLPKDFKAESIQWPYPTIFTIKSSSENDSPQIINFGYKNEVFLLIPIQTPKTITNEMIDINAQVKWLICKENCIPGSAELKISLPVSTKIPKPNLKWIKPIHKAKFKLPVHIPDWQINATTEKQNITLEITPPSWFKGEISDLNFFPYEKDIIDYSAPVFFKKTATKYLLKLKRPDKSKINPIKLKGILVSKYGWRGENSEKALKIDIPFTESNPLFTLLLSAFLGGILLNLMPCVFPILSIKILNFIQQSGEKKTRIRLHGILFSLGILISLWVLVAILISLRAGGLAVGWGFQFQNPNFVIFINALLFLFALNLFGVFEIGLSFSKAGSIANHQKGLWNSFVTGILATIIATPCSAPFMAVPIGFALSQPAFISLLIFSSLGLGYSLPYLILAFFPELLRFIPKPGRWMESIRQFLGFPLMATVIWLLWVFGSQTDIYSVAILLIALLTMGMGAWVLGRWGTFSAPKLTRIIAYILAIMLIFGGFVFALIEIPDSTSKEIHKTKISSASNEPIKWLTFSPEKVKELRQTRKPIFIDFTAKWCATCLYNKNTAIYSDPVIKKFNELGVVALKADFTRYDPVIAQELAKFGRAAVPLNIIYGTNPNQEPIILPVLLTTNIILEALEKIK